MAKKSSRHYPVVRSFPLSEASPHAGRSYRYIDVGKSLSQINRRLYRQGRYYEVKLDLEPDSNTAFEVFAIRDDWAVQKAFQMAYQAYLDNSMEERELLAKTQIARWEDFRVGQPVTSTLVANAGPVLRDGSVDLELVGQGEHDLTQVVDGSGTQKAFSWQSAGSASIYSILEEYSKAGKTQLDPASSTTGVVVPYDNLTTQVQAQMAENLETKGNEPPYVRDDVHVGGPLVRIATLQSNNPNAQKLSTGFFTAPCGIVIIRQSVASDIRTQYSLTVKAGDYKGVHAPSMIEVATVNRKRKVVK